MLNIFKIYLASCISLVSVLIISKIIINDSVKFITKKQIILSQIACILQVITSISFDGTLKTLLMFIINVFLLKNVFKLPFSKSILMVFLYMLACVIPEIMEIVFITNILGLSKEYCYEIFANSILSNIIIFILTVLIIYLLRKPLRKIINIKLEDNIKIIIYNILTFACISIFFYRAFSNLVLNANLIASIFVMITFLAILISLIKQTSDNNKLSKKYDKLLEFMTTYEIGIEKQRIQRHETKNEFLTIRAKLCDNQENSEIVEYIDEILKEKIKVIQEEYAKFGYLPANGIKGLCYFKIQQAEENGINVSLNISKRIIKSTVYDLSSKEQKDFGRILGVLLDNAIEASMNSKKKQIGIEAYANSKKEFKMIISNTYDNEIDMNKVGKEKFSTKGKNRGHGLLLVKQITNENKQFEVKTNIQKTIYTQTILIKKV